jgi:hypothetical protein
MDPQRDKIKRDYQIIAKNKAFVLYKKKTSRLKKEKRTVNYREAIKRTVKEHYEVVSYVL